MIRINGVITFIPASSTMPCISEKKSIAVGNQPVTAQDCRSMAEELTGTRQSQFGF